jgi:hypothetical protein
MKPSYYEYEFETKLEENKLGYKIVRTYLERDDQDDCIKNMWTVIAEKTNGEFAEDRPIGSKLPTYTFSWTKLGEVVDNVILEQINS